jgi:hypothetical protein
MNRLRIPMPMDALPMLLPKAWRRADAGDRQGAIEVLRSFVSTEASNLHREIAHHELEQLEATPGA